jgi:hypothetical protein
VRLEEVHILFGKFVFASEAAHCRSFELPAKTVENEEYERINLITRTRTQVRAHNWHDPWLHADAIESQCLVRCNRRGRKPEQQHANRRADIKRSTYVCVAQSVRRLTGNGLDPCTVMGHSTPALGPTRPPTQWQTGSLSGGEASAVA